MNKKRKTKKEDVEKLIKKLQRKVVEFNNEKNNISNEIKETNELMPEKYTIMERGLSNIKYVEEEHYLLVCKLLNKKIKLYCKEIVLYYKFIEDILNINGKFVINLK